ncbi:MAG: hypothetical protein GY856_17825, partial [bacterium]|nr:hypothetical protein [bacterium]
MTAAAVLVREARRIGSYDRSYCAKLCAVARDAGAAWEDRRLAALLFQWQLLEAPDDAELGRWLRELGLVQASGAGERIVEDVLAQGYTTTEVAPFVTEFRRHLARRGRVRRHFRAAARDEPPVRLSRSECKLALGRYLFRPGEVVDRVVASLRKSAGARAIVAPALVTDEMRGIRARLPEYEAAIVDGLVRDERIYWVAEATSSDVNALVEYPLGTVVVVVKPPGSDLEIEIKRCGRRRPCPIRVVPATRVVDWSHRLDGGSVAGMLHHEVAAICRLLHLYRRIHGGEAPVSLPVSVATVRRVPTGGGDVDVVDLLSDTTASAEKWAGKPKLFELLSKGIRPAGVGAKPEQVERFLGRMTPTQAVLAGTSSFRLDLLSRQLAPAGDHPHPDEELSDADRRHLADELLEEILGVYQPPEGDPDSHEHYLAAAFSQPENRRRADDAFRAVMQQLGTFWGTVWGIGGYSYGESFVARNVGLRTVWHQGRWQVRVIFMDHDDLHVYPESVESEDVATQALIRRLDGRLLDQHFLVGEPSEGCTVGHLERLYRVDETVAREGRVVLQRALAAAYRKALAAAEAMPELFPERFGEHLRDWDEVAGSFCTLRERSPQTVADWRRELRARLTRRGCSREWLDAAFAMVERYEDYLVRGDFFYQALAVPADRVFVINLDRRRDRWDAFLKGPPFRYDR